jgi:Rrf2 family protein
MVLLVAPRETESLTVRLEITRRSDLAVRAMRSLAAEPVVWKASALAATIGTTPGFLNQVLAPLVRAGWVRSAVGPTGGYRYASPAAPSMLDVIEATEGPTLDDRCVLQNGTRCAGLSGGSLCALHDGWCRAREALVTVLGRTSALEASAVRPPARRGPARRIRLQGIDPPVSTRWHA